MPVPSMLPPLPRPLASHRLPLRQMRALLAWGFGMSLLVHAIIGPIVGRYKTPVADGSEISIVSLTRRTTIKLTSPTPPPQSAKRPAPRSDRTTPPLSGVAPPPGSTSAVPRVRAAQPMARLKINVYKTTNSSNAGSSSEERYRVQTGSQLGVPQGTLASAPPGAPVPRAGSSLEADSSHRALISRAAPSSSAGTPTEFARTPAPACAVENVQARATHLAEPFYPEAVRELGSIGEVDVLVSLSATGAVTAASIYHSAGNAALDLSAIRAARESSYAPEIVACQAIPGTYTFHASFTLDAANRRINRESRAATVAFRAAGFRDVGLAHSRRVRLSHSFIEYRVPDSFVLF